MARAAPSRLLAAERGAATAREVAARRTFSGALGSRSHARLFRSKHLYRRRLDTIGVVAGTVDHDVAIRVADAGEEEDDAAIGFADRPQADVAPACRVRLHAKG